MITPPGLQLSAAQQRILEHVADLPALVDAGAGTGKTFTIVERVASLHERGICPANKILILTFARKAAAELKTRFASRLAASPDCFTFHAFAWNVLSAHSYDVGLSPDATVIDDVEAKVEFRKALEEYLHEPAAADSGFPLRPHSVEEIRNELFRIGQGLKQEGIPAALFRERALEAAERFARVGYRELRSPYKGTYRGQSHKIVAVRTETEFAAELLLEKKRVGAAADVLERFESRLQSRNALTYADLLILTERALRQHPGLREELRAKYRYCIVDEYQDTDRTQARLLQALYGDDLSGVMVVGDVLQSIYSFRGAHPQNIQAVKAASGAQCYPLHDNRRSAQEILDIAHVVIRQAHGEAQHLTAYRGSAGRQIVQISCVRFPEGVDYLPFDEARLIEAENVARQICLLLTGDTEVERRDGTRSPISPSDIAILARTKSNVQPVTNALLERGIPFQLVGGVGFYDAAEIRDTMAWLRLLADPMDAQAMTRALQSRVVGASDAVLTVIAEGLDRDETAFSKRVLFEVSKPGSADVPEDLLPRETVERFRRLLDDISAYAALPLTSALQTVLEKTGLRENWQASSDPRSPQALANLDKLESLTRRFASENPGAQPADFVLFMDELERIEYDEREADVSSQDAVTISTIHAAKGLEWPVVFVLGIWPRLANPPRLFVDDASGALLYAENPDGSTPFHYTAVKQKADDEGIVPRADEDDDASNEEEELRLFYVAITRARDLLYLCGLRTKGSAGDEPGGRPHKYLEAAYQWMAEHSWPCDEDVPQAPAPPLRITPQTDGAISAARAALRERIEVAPSVTAVPALSYSSIARYEQCPRRVIYKAMFRLPEIVPTQGSTFSPAPFDGASDADDGGPPEGSILNVGEQGQLVHKALELWALDRMAGALKTPAGYIAAASQALNLTASPAKLSAMAASVGRVSNALTAWMPLHVEAPFTLDLGEEGSRLLVSGYIDLVAKDETGRYCLLDYKTGDAHPASDYALQVALYQAAVRAVYSIDDARCFIGRIGERAFSLEPVTPIAEEELSARILAVRDGLRAQNVTPIPGDWCFSCPYRGAPCQDYKR